ncbi:MAG: methylated-DNA--[protein]-cysteine S-methyltransferase [Planctomycetes bacterium]|nr:methylated-DNA--[protein]-cysteine S-methyltransferase [Planctomycetota bacterium]
MRRSASFFQQVYDVVATIPRGKVMTYGLIGQVLGGFYSGRTVGFAMRVAPAERNLPCHRVVNIKGEMAPGLIFGGADQQQALLKSEGVKFRPDGRIDFDRSLYDPRQPAKTIKSRKKKKPLSRS